jgi:Fe-S-cluster containining protein
MKMICLDRPGALDRRLVQPGETFHFRCHPGVACFNRCCRNLNLFLYPYDVLRLKNRLGLTSEAFLERHTDLVLRQGEHFPEVLLRMTDNAERTCPFLEEAGCGVYPDRPDTCRSFPVEFGLVFEGQRAAPRSVAFFRPPDFCRGPDEPQTWTLDSWMDDQEARVYHRMTRRWAEIRALFAAAPWEGRGPECPKGKMAFMAVFNMEAFREFVFASTFLKRYRVPADRLQAARTDDQALLELGFAWVPFFLGRRPSALIRPR